MSPVFSFMTGANRYRLQARDLDEAIQIAFSELQPNEDAKAVILRTIYDEDEAKKVVSSGESAPEPADPKAKPTRRPSR